MAGFVEDINAPKGEILMASYWVRGECRYIITAKAARDVYYLYSIVDSKPKKVGKAATPVDLEERYMKCWCEQ